MRPIFSQPSVEANMTPSAPSVERANAGAAFERLATRLRSAGLVWAQSEPGHVRWSLADDFLTSLVADSAWIRRQVDDAAQRWMNGAPTTPEQPIPGCWLLPSGSRQRSDGVARGVAIAITSKAVGSSGSLRALCQSANMDFELTRDLLRSEAMVTTREIPRLAAMVRLLRPVALRPTGTPAVEALLRAMESTHRCVRGHSERTAHLAECLANAAGMTAGECRTARMAGLLHDVGKMGIPEQVLSKPGSLTAEDWQHSPGGASKWDLLRSKFDLDGSGGVEPQEFMTGLKNMALVLPIEAQCFVPPPTTHVEMMKCVNESTNRQIQNLCKELFETMHGLKR